MVDIPGATVNVFRLEKFYLQQEIPPAESQLESGGSSYWLWADGPLIYLEKLKLAFPALVIERVLQAKAERYTWCAEIEGFSSDNIQNLTIFLELLKRTLFVPDLMDDCFALGWHSRPGKPGKPDLTVLGQWIHLAKSYHTDASSPGSLPMAGLIADQMTEFIRRHPLYRSCDGIVAALPSNPDKTFDLPTVVAQQIAENTGIPFLKRALIKTRPTAQMKFCLSHADKMDNISGSISCEVSLVRGKRIIVIDDIIGSGFTLLETSRVLRQAGVACVLGLAATKTLKTKYL